VTQSGPSTATLGVVLYMHNPGSICYLEFWAMRPLGLGSYMRRRDFITLLGGAVVWPLAAKAQQAAVPVIGYLNPETPAANADRLRLFLQGLNEAGYVAGRNVSIEFRSADDRYDRLPEMAAELARLRPAVIFTPGVPATTAAKAATATVPIVFLMGADPVASGLVASLNRPGANLTGVSTLSVALGQKQVELLHELAPAASVLALLINPQNPSAEAVTGEVDEAARKLGLTLRLLRARTERDLDTVFANFDELKAGGLIISNEGLFLNRSAQLAALTVRDAVPAIHVIPEFAAAGGLMSYGGSRSEAAHQVGAYIGRILKGEKPGDLPVQQVTKFELTINMKTAKALGLSVPPILQATADEVIE
jgi:putative ABC transport system substrate-binding protein